jgi:hypothetical protein
VRDVPHFDTGLAGKVGHGPRRHVGVIVVKAPLLRAGRERAVFTPVEVEATAEDNVDQAPVLAK